MYLAETCIEKHYKNIVYNDFILKQPYNSIMEIPELVKIVINTSSKLIISEKKFIIPAVIALELLTGQKLKHTKTKKSIAAFKCRKNQLIGCKVTLRNHYMFNFLEKIQRIILPHSREFYGIQKKKLDFHGNFSIGINNLLFFPELENHYQLFDYIKGINITFITKKSNKEKTSLFLSGLQIPVI